LPNNVELFLFHLPDPFYRLFMTCIADFLLSRIPDSFSPEITNQQGVDKIMPEIPLASLPLFDFL
jgi:hypothetical protein